MGRRRIKPEGLPREKKPRKPPDPRAKYDLPGQTTMNFPDIVEYVQAEMFPGANSDIASSMEL